MRLKFDTSNPEAWCKAFRKLAAKTMPPAGILVGSYEHMHQASMKLAEHAGELYFAGRMAYLKPLLKEYFSAASEKRAMDLRRVKKFLDKARKTKGLKDESDTLKLVKQHLIEARKIARKVCTRLSSKRWKYYDDPNYIHAHHAAADLATTMSTLKDFLQMDFEK